MMSLFSGYTFFVYLLLLLLPAIFLGMAEKTLRGYRIVLTVWFIWAVFHSSPVQFLYLIFYAVLSIYTVKIYLFLRQKYGRNRYIYVHAVFFAIAPLIISKISGIYGKNWLAFLGVSYMCFRVVQVLIETYDGVIKEINEIQFLEFLLFFPSLSSGPIDRSRRFAEDDGKIYTREEYLLLLSSGLYKIVLGLFYKVVCSGIFYKLLSEVFAVRYKPAYLVGYAYVYGLYMFFDFAGYSAMAVGASYVLGIRMPDNFNKPFLSIDMKDFWNRWHITLSTWFRDFIFTRFMLDSARKKRFKKRLNGAAVGLILNMTIMGLWHGLEPHYIIYGIYHGILMAITEIYQKKSKFYSRNKEKQWYKFLSWFVTINLVMFGFLIFSGHIQQIWNVVINYL
ncbi:D-alanyl-lipoteichoic acid biosynthesis protein DltB [[Clostridium] symbiosum]|uniref:D-alanyl-lipoteichoic acid biosynthesis protein DltB n=1 Tax=Clostridium symbiosum TaxID=1512 RepID=UPI001D08A19C|nr:D-alanyl-lipoteichoic acid biosynthesis protein DltB [[Clostridium] symbiosum]MCB6610940.1 D-alanyl-lipoteichoic acid biosynthesis protein DltB [[Clostridium] symbiosum]MCB6931614.1 D-alanyl-lipoteichoic acid biosynthesis protein DltB [[Clostridium] symbiosum]